MAQQREQEKYIIRFPSGMRDLIRDEAARNCRTMNAEIIFRLNCAYGANDRVDTMEHAQ